jgi:hypothetical protein
MSKELEALERLYFNKNSLEYCDKYTDEHIMNGAEIDFNLIRKALTPPTADEVCKEVEEYLYKCVGKASPYLKFCDKTKKFIYVDFCDNGKEYDFITITAGGYVNFIPSLPPHLITLIGRFYEGLEQ